MKAPYPRPCENCDYVQDVIVKANQDFVEWDCEKCGHRNRLWLAVTIGPHILQRAKAEYERRDYSIAIAFAALAVEAELAHLYRKWREYEDISAGKWTYPLPEPDPYEEEWRRIKTSEDRIRKACRLMGTRDIDRFVAGDAHLSQMLGGFPQLNGGPLPKKIAELFWPRNRVLHWGYAEHREEEARSAFNTARFALEVLRRLNIARAARD